MTQQTLFRAPFDASRDHRDDGNVFVALLIAVPVGFVVWAVAVGLVWVSVQLAMAVFG